MGGCKPRAVGAPGVCPCPAFSSTNRPPGKAPLKSSFTEMCPVSLAGTLRNTVRQKHDLGRGVMVGREQGQEEKRTSVKHG